MDNRFYWVLALLCLGSTVPQPGRAQAPTQLPAAAAPVAGSISGVLVDSVSAAPVEFATVTLLRAGDKQSAGGTLTNVQGQFTLAKVPAGDYEVVCSFVGYRTKIIRSVAVTEAAPAVELGRIAVRPASTQLQEVTVQGLRPTIVQEADRMVVSIANTALAAGRSAYDVLTTAPGVFIDQDGNIQLNGRSGVTVMLDGKLTYLSARDLRTLLEGMTAENIKNIEIITNPSAKYDAEGSSGILNINLKKNEVKGMSGSVYAGSSYNGDLVGYNAGATLNNQAGPWNSFLTLDYARRVGGRQSTFTRVFYGRTETTYFDQTAGGNFVVQGPPAVRLGTDYRLNDRHSVGGLVSFATNTLRDVLLNDTYVGPSPGQPLVYLDTRNQTTNTFRNLTTNLHYAGKLDTAGTTLTADLDWAKIANRGDVAFRTFFDTLTNSRPVVQDLLSTNSRNGFDIYAAKVDFTKPLARGRKLELGAKASRVVSDNDLRFYFNNGEVPLLDPTRTNRFIYQENIYAAYVNGSGKLGERLTVQAGLRAEQTVSEGESRTTGDVTPRRYLQLFPSAFLQQQVTGNYQIGYSYSKRIQRPNYGQLNPFVYYRDPYTRSQGNPYLRPQYTHAFGLTQTWKKTYSLALNYQRLQDVFFEIPTVDVETATTLYYNGNVDRGQNLSATAVVPVRIMKNWESSNTVVMSYNEYTAQINGEQLVNDQFFYQLQTSQNMLLPHGFKGEINASYLGEAVYGLYRVEPRWWVNLGLKKSFLHDKLDVSLNANDIFRTNRPRVTALVGGGNVSKFDQYTLNRNVSFTVRYNFSRGAKVNTKQRTNTLEELNRTGGG